MRIPLVLSLSFALSFLTTGCDESQMSSFVPKGSPGRAQVQTAGLDSQQAAAQLAAEAQAEADALAAGAEEWTTNEMPAAAPVAPAANLEAYADAARQQVEALQAQGAQQVQTYTAAAHTTADHAAAMGQQQVEAAFAPMVPPAKQPTDYTYVSTYTAGAATGLAADIDGYAAQMTQTAQAAPASYGAIGLAADIDGYAAQLAAQATQAAPAAPTFAATGLAAEIDGYAAQASQAAQSFGAVTQEFARIDTENFAEENDYNQTDGYIPPLPGAAAEFSGYGYAEAPQAPVPTTVADAQVNTYAETDSFAEAQAVVRTNTLALPAGEDYIRIGDLLPGPLSMNNE